MDNRVVHVEGRGGGQGLGECRFQGHPGGGLGSRGEIGIEHEGLGVGHWLEGFLGRLGGDGGRFRRDVGGRLGQFVGPCRRAGGEGQKGDERPQDPGLE